MYRNSKKKSHADVRKKEKKLIKTCNNVLFDAVFINVPCDTQKLC